MKTASLISLSVAFFAPAALGALTASEKAVVETFIEKGVLESAPRVRALVARPDLGPEEVSEPLKKGYLGSPFDEQHQRFTEALLFGPGSDAARNTLAPALVEALLARAASRMAEIPVAVQRPVTDAERGAIDEALAIHAFVDEKIANAGAPPPDGHDLASGIREDGYRAAALLYKAHVAAHRRWLALEEPVPEGLLRLETQIAVATADLARGIFSPTEVADWLGLSGERRAEFERRGVLVEGGSNARIPEVVRLLESATGAANGLSVWVVDKAPIAGLVARGRIARVGVPLVNAMRPIASDRIWAGEVTPSHPDVALVEAARSAAELAAGRAMSDRPSLRERARAAAEHAASAGASGYLAVALTRLPLPAEGGGMAATPSGEEVVAGALELLLLDAERALDLALIRGSAGRPEPLEQLAIALSVLAADGKHVALGRVRPDGGVEAVAATDVTVENDAATSFTYGGKHYAIGAGKGGAFVATIDGAPPKLTKLADYRPLPVAADSWSVGPVTYEKLFGDPHAVGLDDGRLVVDGSEAGCDAIAVGAEAEDSEASATILPSGAGGGLVLRGRAGDSSYAGVTLRLEPASHKAELLYVGARGKTVELGPSVKLPDPPSKGYSVTLWASGPNVTAKVGSKTLTGTIEEDIGSGRAGLSILAGGRLEVRDFRVKPRSAR